MNGDDGRRAAGLRSARACRQETGRLVVSGRGKRTLGLVARVETGFHPGYNAKMGEKMDIW
jgi:hypothetical protein